jgi:hypothetical protein
MRDKKQPFKSQYIVKKQSRRKKKVKNIEEDCEG